MSQAPSDAAEPASLRQVPRDQHRGGLVPPAPRPSCPSRGPGGISTPGAAASPPDASPRVPAPWDPFSAAPSAPCLLKITAGGEETSRGHRGRETEPAPPIPNPSVGSPSTPWAERAVTPLRHPCTPPHQCHRHPAHPCSPSQRARVPCTHPGERCHGVRDARGGGSTAPASITCPLPALGSASPAQHPSPAPRSVTQQVKGRGTHRPEPSRPPARGTYCCRGCRSRRAAAGRGGSVAPCSALSSASSRLASHNKGGEGGRRGAAGPGGGLAGRRGHTAACPAAPCLFCQGHPRKEVLAGNGSASRLPPLPRRGGAEPSVPRTTQPHQPPAVPGDGEVGTVAAWALGCGGPQTAPVALGGKGLCHCHCYRPLPDLILIPFLCPRDAQAVPLPRETSPGAGGGCKARRPLLVPLPRRSQHPGSPPCPPQRARLWGRQGLNCPPHLLVAKGNNIKCQSHQH